MGDITGEPTVESLNVASGKVASDLQDAVAAVDVWHGLTQPIPLSAEAHGLLTSMFQGLSDEQYLQLLLARLRES